MACESSIEPLQLPILNSTLNSGSTFARGIAIGIGTPQQILSLLPKTYVEQVVLSNTARCDLEDPVCLSAFGGIYDSSESNSFAQVTMAQWNASTENENLRNEDLWFYDTISYGSNSSTDGFPLVMKKAGTDLTTDVEQGTIGLDAGSLFLSNAFGSGSAPSTAYGLYPGSRSHIAPADGLLVLGGYDRARVEGELVPQTYNRECVPCLTVNSILYHNDEGNATVELEPFQVVADASARYLGLPPGVYQNFKDVLNVNSTEPYFPTVANDTVFGEVIVEFESGLTTTIPVDQFFHRLAVYDSAGDLVVSERGTYAALADNTEEKPPGLNVWGLPFTNQFYFVVDHEREEWSLGRARKDVDSAIRPDVQPICPLKSESATTSSSSTSKGAIAGGVVGGAAAVLTIIAAIWFWRRKRSRKASPPEASAKLGDVNAAEVDADGPMRRELDTSQPTPPMYEKMGTMSCELDGNAPAVIELPGSPVSPNHSKGA